MLVMPASPAKAAYRRYLWRFFPLMVAYVVIVYGVSWLFDRGEAPNGWLGYLLAVLPAVPIVGVIFIMGLYIVEEKDEFMRMRHVVALLSGLAIIMSVSVVWGFLEIYMHVPHLSAFWFFPGFCMAWGFSSGILAWVYR
jgi:hypothetical protein